MVSPTPLKINIISIFFSISGEINMWPQGTPVIFIRFAGCNLNCVYCDTPESISAKGIPMSVPKILDEIAKFPSNRVLITGGEPLLQRKGLNQLIENLTKLGYEVSVETNGSLPLQVNNHPDCWVVDIKMPESGQFKQMIPIHHHLKLSKNIIFKIPIQNEEDIKVAKNFLESSDSEFSEVALSPVSPLTPSNLWELMYKYKMMDCILNTQIHKMVGFE